MNREQMVENGARVLWEGAAPLIVPWDELRELVREAYRDDVRTVLNAVLPQVTTVAELEALPHRTAFMINRNGATIHKMREWADEGGDPFYAVSGTSGVRWSAETVIEYAGAHGLTVVWQPEVTS